MSIPAVDPDFTGDDLEASAERLLDAALAYWEDLHRFDAQLGGAVVWLEDTDGRLVLFTRSEYRDTLLENITGRDIPVHFFAHGDEGSSTEGAR